MHSLPLIHMAEVDSTQAFLQRHPELGHCAVLADHQTAGRGRGDNTWESPAGAGLWLSAALPLPPLEPGLVLQWAMGAVAEQLQTPEVSLGLKWPNDLVAWKNGRLVKLGGMIGELQPNHILLGLGINLTAAPDLPDRPIPAACLQELGMTPPAAPVLARRILERWSHWEIPPQPAFRWPDAGALIAWEEGQGRCLGWLEDGRLDVQTDLGRRLLSAGDIRALSSRSSA